MALQETGETAFLNGPLAKHLACPIVTLLARYCWAAAPCHHPPDGRRLPPAKARAGTDAFHVERARSARGAQMADPGGQKDGR